MTILQALSSYYDRMAARGEAERPGFSREKISFAVILARNGTVIDVVDVRDHTGKKPRPVLRDVPAAAGRTSGIKPYFLWDKTAYVLGATAGAGKRLAEEHQAFRDLHFELLADTDDAGLAALRFFLENWVPERFSEPPFSDDMLDTNIVFRLDGDVDDSGAPRFIHQRPAAAPLVAARTTAGETGRCLVTGEDVPIARLHPTIGGVDGAQSSGAALVSFNLDAFESWGRKQGDNAPTGETAAFRYGAALNRLLDRSSRHRLRIGDATTVFWADTSATDESHAAAAEDYFAILFGAADRGGDQDATEAVKLRDALEPLAAGRPVTTDLGELRPSTQLHVLGLAPNAARLAIRFWFTQSLGDLARNLAAHEADCRVEPLPWKTPPSINRLLVNTTAAQQKWDNIPPLLAGEVARAVLGGGRYPRSLLSAAIMRLRAGDDPARGWHAAAIRAVLERDKRRKLAREGAPMSLDREETNPAYRLGRLFAVLEAAQYGALGRVNATIRDRYFGAASATPASVFPLLLRGAQNHLATLRKERFEMGVSGTS
ncbi:type I-C CRISPR-associated protein Cas8c/Csd1 [Stakelama saccharophila]|uniref:Type I-C CRISPR-associated protein Cas8c/Csd1 n=1 Tax=Stakelama saccharophila TaxID=3075605 RepID=A0ABZ0B885_9SPHN|nr:type I-C CRISPR-associated protein Cas8c/Csd1 [Stakelama sp. W311]WNO53647.1 type I-C CRISPR-associated protein Cas8c/Csd1 [Stakelama sp. W311]